MLYLFPSIGAVLAIALLAAGLPEFAAIFSVYTIATFLVANKYSDK